MGILNLNEELPSMTTRAQEVLAEQNQPIPPKKLEPSKEDKKLWAELKEGIDQNKTYKGKLIRNWSLNIDYRRGKPFPSAVDDDQIAVNLDWAYTKTKQSSLFSQVPEVRVTHQPELTDAPWANPYERKLNDILVTAGIEAAMEECTVNCINAAGFGAVIAYYDAITEDREVPAINLGTLPPEVQRQIMQTGLLPNGNPVPMETVPYAVDKHYVIESISPADFLWPIDFNKSDFDKAPWIGRTGRVTWTEAMRKWKLDPSDKDRLMGEEISSIDSLTHDADRESAAKDNKVGYDELFYREHMYHADGTRYDAIRHIVFLHSKDEPVVYGPWTGQKFDDDSGELIGALKYPIRVLTLTYLTDEAIPPSDTAVGRAQVNEINKGRTLQIRQRARSLPVNWYDVNRLDPTIQHGLMRGTWQAHVPVQGDGSRVIGTVQHNAMHQENFAFDTIAKTDLRETWSIGPNQLGSGEGVETKGESSVLQSNFTTKISRERAKVASFITSIAQVIGGLMCLYEEPETFGEGFSPAFSRSLQFSILADSTILVDSQQRLERLNGFLNAYIKTGWVSLQPVLKEVATLIGLDPNVVVVPPQPAQPDLPNISLRLSGADDMMNPLLLAFMLKTGQAPTEDLIEKAKQLIQQTVVIQDPSRATPPGSPLPETPPPMPGDAYPQASAMPSIVKRTDDPAEIMKRNR